MKKTDKIFVAGHNGLVGSAIVRQLENQGYINIITKSRKELDLRNQFAVDRFFDIFRPDYVFLAAAKAGGIYYNKTYPADFITENLQIQTNVITSAYQYKVKKLLYLGSACIYPKITPQPIREEYLLTGELEPTNDAYAIAKIAGIFMCQKYHQQYGFNCISLMPTNLYGTCFSEDTEVITVEGIKNIKDLKISDKIYTLNPKTHEIEIENIIDVYKEKTNEFINFKSKGCDLKVTPEHKIYYTTGKNFYKKPASYFKKYIGKKYGQFSFASNLPYKKGLSDYNFSLLEYKDDAHIINDDMMKDGKHSRYKFYPINYKLEDICSFIGWYVSEGSIVDNMKTLHDDLDCGQIRISQNKKNNIKNYNEIDDLLKRMNLSYGKDDYAFYFTSRAIKTFIRNEIGVGCKNKKLPKFIFDLSYDYRLKVFDSMMKGDGNKNGSKYSTTSEQLKNDFMHLAFTLGFKTSYKFEKKIWRIFFRKVRKNVTIKTHHITNNFVDNEDVYCITTEKNHIIYAGRNGKFNWVGQCDKFDIERSHVIPALINKFYDAKINNKDHIVCWGDGSPTREFLFSDDLADMCLFLMDNYDSPEIINVGIDNEITIKELTEKIKTLIGFEGNIIWDESKPNGTPLRKLSYDKLSNLGWKPKYDLDTGLKITIDWYLKNKDICK
jgi:nucleoside-diphosphate-sugar epimerase